MKKQYALYAATPILALSLLGAGMVSAHGMGGWGFGSKATPQEMATNLSTRFQAEATLLGISVDEVKAAWALGKNVQQLAQEKGITKEQLQQKLKDQNTAQMTTQLKALVAAGVITQAQADQRLQFMNNQTAKVGKHGRGMMFRGGF